MKSEQIHLQRKGRLVLASGPGRTPLSAGTYNWMADALTYYEKKFDPTAAPGENFDFIDRRIYNPGPFPRTLVFPLGMRSRIAKELAGHGASVTLTGRSMVDEIQGTPAGEVDWDALLDSFTVHPDQQQLLFKVTAADGGIVSAPTGLGKSVLVKMICKLYPKARIHVATKSVQLADEIYGDLLTVVPTVGMVGGGKRKPARVTVYVADSLHHGMGQADLLLLDELHQLLAPRYVEMIGRYQTARIFAFSATPTGRSDGRDILGEAICGPVLQTMHYQDGVAMGRIVPITVEWIPMRVGPDTSGIRNIAIKDRFAISRNIDRNKAIAERVSKFSDDEQVMIIVKTIDHAVQLKSLLPDFTMAYAANGMDEDRLEKYIEAGELPPNEPLMTRERLSSLRKAFADGTLKKVISNYVWSTGVNFRNLSVLVRADAAASEILDGQIPGRISRRVPGQKESALLIDCWDEWDSRLMKKAQSRSRNYRKRAWNQVWPQSSPVGVGL